MMVLYVGVLVVVSWSGDRLSEPSTHPSFCICWLSCAACPVSHVCPVLRVFFAECEFSPFVWCGCAGWGFLFLFFPCSPPPSVPLRRREAQEAQQCISSLLLCPFCSSLSCPILFCYSCPVRSFFVLLCPFVVLCACACGPCSILLAVRLKTNTASSPFPFHLHDGSQGGNS